MKNKSWYLRYYKDFLKLAEECVGKKTTDEGTLTDVGQSFFGDDFEGVYARDEVPQTFKYAIVNLDKRNGEGGTHWVAMANMGNDQYMVHDSFGRKTTAILPDLNLDTVDTEPDAEQLKSQDNCGARCLAWLILFDEFGPAAAQTI